MKNDSYERGFDEETGKMIDAGSCPLCGGSVRVDGGEIECRGCGVALNEYARTGRLPERVGDERGSRAEVA